MLDAVGDDDGSFFRTPRSQMYSSTNNMLCLTLRKDGVCIYRCLSYVVGWCVCVCVCVCMCVCVCICVCVCGGGRGCV